MFPPTTYSTTKLQINLCNLIFTPALIDILLKQQYYDFFQLLFNSWKCHQLYIVHRNLLMKCKM